jgi:FkbM family methyltransferase
MLRTFLGWINHSIVWKKPVNVWDASFLPPTFDRWLALQAHRFGIMGAAEIEFLRRFVRPNWRIADVGANQGIYALLLSRLASLGQVYAFEPDPSLFGSLQENVRRNDAKNVSLFNAAAASQVAKLVLRPGRLNRGDNRFVPHQPSDISGVEVDAIPLDQALPESRLNLLKIDVQGFEVEVLKGAQQLLQNSPTLLIQLEFWPHGLRLANSDPVELIDLLTAAGFFLFRTGKPGSLEPFSFQERAWRRSGQFCNLVASRDQRFGKVDQKANRGDQPSINTGSNL